MENEDKGIHDGHRARMRAKFSLYGHLIFDTYELLEMLLYNVIPYRDTNPIAKRLLSAFGGIDGVMRASAAELSSVSGVGERCAELLTLVGMADSVGEASSDHRPTTTFDDFSRTGKFLVEYFKENPKSSVVIMLLDNSMRLLGISDIPSTKFGSGATAPKYFIDAAMRFGATVAVVAFTHRSGIAYPYDSDIVTCKMLTSELSGVGVTLLECYIVEGDSYAHVGPIGTVFRCAPTPEIASFEHTRMNGENDANNGYGVSAPLCEVEELVSVGSESVSERYLEELLGFSGVKDPAGSAEALSTRFGSLDAVLTQSFEALTEYVGERGAMLLKLVAALVSRSRCDCVDVEGLSTDADIARYLVGLFYGTSVETVYLLSLDAKGRVKACDCLGSGTINASDVYPRRIIECAIRRGAKKIVLAHNHPLGTAKPSGDDMVATASLCSTCTSAGIELVRHVIIAERDHFVLVPDPVSGVITAKGRVY